MAPDSDAHRGPRRKAKEHFLVLDWLRGIAAVLVVAFHWFAGQGSNWLYTAPMAVDFFFLLSGFVIANAYDEGLAKTMTVRRFLHVRFVRLYPMIVLGTLLGLLRLVLHDAAQHDLAPVGHYIFGVVAELLLVPDLFNRVGDRAIFLIDGPMWSLFFEVVANVIYAVFFRQIGNRFILATLVAFAAVALSYGVYATPGEINIGWASDTALLGLPRVLFSFFAGVALFRLRVAGYSLPFAAGPLVLSGVLALWLCQPSGILAPAGQLAAIFVGFPLIVLLGAGMPLSGKWAQRARWLGALSYPLYLLHEPLLWMWTGLLKFTGAYLEVPMLASGLVAFSVAVLLSQFALKYLDEPIRRWLGAMPSLRLAAVTT